jgi:hypothetical protein
LEPSSSKFLEQISGQRDFIHNYVEIIMFIHSKLSMSIHHSLVLLLEKFIKEYSTTKKFRLSTRCGHASQQHITGRFRTLFSTFLINKTSIAILRKVKSLGAKFGSTHIENGAETEKKYSTW